MIRTHPIVEEILNEISPQYSRATAAEATIYEWMEQPRPPHGDPAIVADTLYAAAREGADPGPELLAELAQIASAQQAWEDYRTGLTIAAQLAREDRAGEIRGTTDKVLAALDARLQTLVGQVRELARDLVGVATAQQAITAGPQTTTAWQALTGLVDTYDQLRAAQAQTVRAYSLLDVSKAGFSYSGGDVADLKALWAVGMVADHLVVEPYWIERRQRMADVLAGVTRANLTTAAPAPRTQRLNREWPEYVVFRSFISGWTSQIDWAVVDKVDADTVGMLADWASEPVRPITSEVGWVDSAEHWPRHDDRVEHLLRLCTTAQPWIPSVPAMRRTHELAVAITQIRSDHYDRPNARDVLGKIREHHQLTTRES